MRIRESIFSPLGITTIYLVMGSLWITFSDSWVVAAVQDVQTLTRLQSYKGLFYIAITAFGLYYLLVQHRLTILKATESYTKELENRVQERTQDLSLLNKEMESFSYSVSHDLQSPLRAVLGFSEEIVQHHSEGLSPTATNYLSRISAAAKRMSVLIDDLLTLARVSKIESKPSEFELQPLVAEVIHDLSLNPVYANTKVSIRLQEVRLVADESLIRILFENLLSNAFKYSSRVTSPHVEVECIRANGHPLIAVRDNGIGFDMLHYDKLFTPFQRLHHGEGYPGNGIGLATVQRVMRHLKGSVRAESEIGKGTVFYITLENTIVAHA